MPISICPEHLWDIFSGFAEGVIRQGPISVFLVKHLLLCFNHLLSPEEVFLAGLRDNYLWNCSWFSCSPCLLLLSPGLLWQAQSWLCCVEAAAPSCQETAWQYPRARLVISLPWQKQEKPESQTHPAWKWLPGWSPTFGQSPPLHPDHGTTAPGLAELKKCLHSALGHRVGLLGVSCRARSWALVIFVCPSEGIWDKPLDPLTAGQRVARK